MMTTTSSVMVNKRLAPALTQVVALTSLELSQKLHSKSMIPTLNLQTEIFTLIQK